MGTFYECMQKEFRDGDHEAQLCVTNQLDYFWIEWYIPAASIRLSYTVYAVIWADNWLIKLNIVKCKKVSFGRYTEITEHYKINNVKLENVESIKDDSVIFDSHLKFELYMRETIDKAYSILGIIRRNFAFLDKDSFQSYISLWLGLILNMLIVSSHAPHTVQDKKKCG